MRIYRTPALLFAAFLPLYVPFRSRFLVNWDAVNFALATLSFDLEHHQPHPPGYIGYVFAGWLLNYVTGDANTSLTLLSLVASAAAPAGFYLLATLFVERRHALWSAVLLGLSPVVWYYSGVALTYAVELALGLFLLWAGYLGRQRRSEPMLVAATLLLVVLGAMRPSGALLLMPLWLYLVWPLVWRARLTTASVLVMGNLLWLVPLFRLSGGIESFVRISRELVNLVVVPTSVFGGGADLPGPLRNVVFVLFGVVVGVNFGLLLIGFGLLANRRAFSLIRRHAAFLTLWLGPSVLVYVLLHTGQLGYVLLILPAFYLLMAIAMQALAAPVSGRAGVQDGRAPARRRPAIGRAGPPALAVANVVFFLAIPPVLWGFVPKGSAPSDASSRERGWVATALETGGVGTNPRQFDVRRSDRYWRDLIEFASQYDPEQTVILSAADPSGSFRHLTFYLPEYRVYGLGWDLQRSFGHLFTAYGGASDYSPRSLFASQPTLSLPSDVTTLIIPDRSVQALLAEGAGTTVSISGGFVVVVLSVSSQATVEVRSETGQKSHIAVASALVEDG